MNIVTCATKKGDNYDPFERISHIGGSSDNGIFKITSDEAIKMIDAGTHVFYVEKGGQRVKVITAVRNDKKYLKTESDGFEPNNLLALGDCS